MAHENIRIQQPNFCLGPQSGTICTVDTTNPQTVLRIKNTSGATVADYSFSSNILNSNVRLEYAGPRNLPSMLNDLTFFTFEKVSNNSCIIKRWMTRVSSSELLLKEQIVKNSTGNERYNGIDFAVEYYTRAFSRPNSYYNYLDMDSTTNVKNGTRLFIGPSTDTDNLGASEVAVVSHIIDYIGGKRVYLTAPLKYQYVIGDPISFYCFVYLYSADGYAGDPNKGALYKFDAYSWSTVSISAKSFYKRVNSCRWCPMAGSIASIINTNMLFVSPYNSYQNWRSMFLSNVTSDTVNHFTVYDVIFDEYNIYKLQRYITLKNDEGIKETFNWDDYNFQQDTLLPYTNNVNLKLDQSVVIGQYQNVDIFAQVRDQFHVGLRDVNLSFYKEGDLGALFYPLSGNVITDSNGDASINYRSGSEYVGHNKISVRATGSSNYTGSVYSWSTNNILSYPHADPVITSLWAKKDFSGSTRSIRQLRSTYQFYDGELHLWVSPYLRIKALSYFTSPGGNWGPSIKLHPEYEPDYNQYYTPSHIVATWLPMLYRGDGNHFDGPADGGNLGFTSYWAPGGGWPYLYDEEPFFIGDRITLLEDFDAVSKIKSLTEFLLYPEGGYEEDGFVPYVIIYQPDESGYGQISQLKLIHHTHWVDAMPYDELWAGVNLDQFIFVEDAVPSFWSEKNPIITNIWLRLRPFAFSLNFNSLRMWVREVSYISDSGYYEITDELEITTFDAGGGTLGLEIFYNPPEDFLHGSLVYVRIEVYDEAYIPNFIYVSYWFKIIPDYKAPYILNMSPDMDETNVPVDTNIYLEIKDEGSGIDIGTLELLINSRRMSPDYLTIEEVSRYYYKITYNPPENLYFNKDYKVSVKVSDISANKNALNTSYYFSTSDSSGVQIVDPNPGVCKRGMKRFNDVSVIALSDGNGVDANSIRMQVYNKDVHPNIVPIIYRIS
jgi:hypothetical protein